MSNGLNRQRRRAERIAKLEDVKTFVEWEQRRKFKQDRMIELYVSGMALALHDALGLSETDIMTAVGYFMDKVYRLEDGDRSIPKELEEKTGIVFEFRD